MSGGHFSSFNDFTGEELDGQWHDAELDELWCDLMLGGEFSVRNYGGLFQSLDFWLSSDTGEEDYREAVTRFKQKWMRRTPKQRVEFYQKRLQEYADRLKREMGEV